MVKLNLSWDGEKIKQVITQEEKKHTPKEILTSLNQVRGQISQMENQRTQLEQQIKTNEKNLADAKEFEKDLRDFEKKCVELQKEKLQVLIKELHQECYDKAVKVSDETIKKDPEAYSEQQKKLMYYLAYQKELATNPKVAEKIAASIITKYLYDEPIFVNPFKKD